MPDLPAYHDGNAKLHSYQHLWMAHWMGKSCNSVLQIYNEDGAGTDIGQANVTSMNMGCESNSGSEWYLFPLSSYNQNIDSLSTVRTNSHTSHDTISHGTATVGTDITDFPSSLRISASKKLGFSSEDDFSLSESIKAGPVQRQKSFGSIEMESLPSSKPFLNILPGTTSSVVPYKHRSGETPAGSFMFKNKVIEEPFRRVASKDIPAHTNLTPFENGTCNCCVDEQGREVNSSSGAGFSPSCNDPERATELEEGMNPGSYLLQKMPVCSVHDEETLKLCSIGDSEKNVPVFSWRISQTTHHLCLTNSFGVSFSKGGQIMGESKLSTEGNAKALYELFSLSSLGRGKQGPKLQSIGHTSSSEGKKDTSDENKDHPCLQKELSAETDMLDIDDCVTRSSFHGM